MKFFEYKSIEREVRKIRRGIMDVSYIKVFSRSFHLNFVSELRFLGFAKKNKLLNRVAAFKDQYTFHGY